MVYTDRLAIDSTRLSQRLAVLARIGQLPAGGVRRISYTPEDLQARQQVRQWMEEAGMSIRIDAAGNLIGTYPGQRSDAPALSTGSHIDTVPSGGRYDGALGVLAGIEVVCTLNEHQIRLNHPIEVIVFTDEEGGMIGSKAMSGRTQPDPEVYRRQEGRSIQECLSLIGGNWDQIATAQRTRQGMAAFVELHVEQGGILEATQTQVGVVQGIVSMNRFTLTVLGRNNHAGTTPMSMRRDALVAAAAVILAVNRLALNTPGDQVATVGYVDVYPNAPNIVPGRVELSLDIRDLSQDHVDHLESTLQIEIEQIAQRTHTKIVSTPGLRVEPTLAEPQIQAEIDQVCEQLHLSHRRMPSRAGHDAQEIGRFTDMGMIFVPSLAGVSHAEDEFTSPEQCAYGTNVLLQTFLRLDQKYA